MTHDLSKKRHARRLRKRGTSIPRIAQALRIAKSTVSLWVRDVPLPVPLRMRLQLNAMRAHEKGRAMRLANLQSIVAADRAQAMRDLSGMRMTQSLARVVAAILYWCEGGKKHLSSGVRFTNSDPVMIRSFLSVFRMGFRLRDDRLRALIHLHEYHDAAKQTAYWSSITGIPKERFYPPYRKPNSGKRVRENYPGCITIYYAEARIVRNLVILYDLFAEKVTKTTGA